MFRRNKENEGGKSDGPTEGISSADIPPPSVKAFSRPVGLDGAGKPTPTPPRPQGGPTAPSVLRPEIPRRAVDIPGVARRPEKAPAPNPDAKRLIVGRDIVLNGQITACERLVVEGRVEAALNDCRTIEVLDGGTFKGSAEVESAEISGRVDGNLTVRQRLLIRATGQISGTVRYGRIEIEEGGEVNGDVRSLGIVAKAASESLAAPIAREEEKMDELPIQQSVATDA
jgi:cytoskeletal protein CcmA (bactofilin family)